MILEQPGLSRAAVLEPVVLAVDVHDGVGVSVTHREGVFEVGDLNHVRRVTNGVELGHPVVNRLAVFLLDGREVGGWAGNFLSHTTIMGRGGHCAVWECRAHLHRLMT